MDAFAAGHERVVIGYTFQTLVTAARFADAFRALYVPIVMYAGGVHALFRAPLLDHVLTSVTFAA